MPIQGKLNDTMHLAETQLPNLVTTMELYCAQLHLARRSEIKAMVLAPKQLLPGVVHDSFEALRIKVHEVIMTPIKEEESNWIRQARKLCHGWTEKFNGQLAILKGEGSKKAQAGKNNGKPVNWNYQLLDVGGDSLETFFDDFCRKIDASAWPQNLTSSLVRLCDDARRNIKRKQTGTEQRSKENKPNILMHPR